MALDRKSPRIAKDAKRGAPSNSFVDRRNIEEIARVESGIKLSVLAPPNIGRAAEHVRDRVLLAVMVDCRAGRGFNGEDSTPDGRVYASSEMNGCETLRSRRLSGCGIELTGTNYTN